MGAAATWFGIFGPPTDLQGLCIWSGEKLVTSLVDLAWKSAWQAFEANFLSNNPPAVASCNGTIYVFYPSSTQQTGYLYYNTYNGTEWSSQQELRTLVPDVSAPVAVQTQTGVGAATFNDEVYVFWQGVNATGFGEPDGTLLYQIMGQDTFSAIQSAQVISGYAPGALMSNCPSAVVFNNVMYVFYQGPGLDGQLWYTFSSDGSNWSPSTNWPNVGIATSPSAVVFTNPSGQEYLYVFYQNSGTTYLSYTSMDAAGNNTGIGGWIEPGGQSVSMSGTPVAMVYSNALYVFYEGSGGGFWYTSSSDGSTWSTPLRVLPTQLSCSPALVNYNGEIYCMMQGPGNDGQLWYTTVTPGSAQLFMTMVNGEIMSQSPGVLVLNDQIYCFIQGSGNSGALYYATFNESGWQPSVKVLDEGYISQSPSPVFFNNLLYVFYESDGQENIQYVTSSNNGGSWSAPTYIYNVGAVSSPSAVVFNNELYVFHAGNGNGESIWYSRLQTNGTWVADTEVPLQGASNSGMSPTAIVFNETLYLFYAELGNFICCMSYDGSSWGTPNFVLTALTTRSSVAAIVYDNSGTQQLYCVFQDGESGYIYYVYTSGNPCDTSSWSTPVQIGFTVPTPAPPGGVAQLTDLAISGIFAMF